MRRGHALARTRTRTRGRGLLVVAGLVPCLVACLVACALACLAACVSSGAGGPVFLDAGFDSAAALADSRHQPLYVFCSARDDVDSARMLTESFAHADVVERLAPRALIVHLPVEQQPELAERLGVGSTPVLLRLEQGVERARREGFLSPWMLIGFVQSQRAFGLAEWDALARDELADPGSRFVAHYERRELLIERGEPQALLERDLWMWREGLRGESASARSMFLGQVAKYAETHAPTRLEFEALRDATRAAVHADPSDADAWEEWVMLDRHFHGGPSVVAFAREVLALQADAQGLSERLGEVWFGVFMDAGDFERVAWLCPDFGSRFAARLEQQLGPAPSEPSAGPVLITPPGPEDLAPDSDMREVRARFLGWMSTDAERWAASSYVAAALAMSRDSQALAVAAALLSRLDDDRSRVALIDGVLRAEAWWRERGLHGESPAQRSRLVLLEWLADVVALRGPRDPDVRRLVTALQVGD